MTVSVLLLTHENVGPTLLRITERVLGVCPLQTDALEVPFDCDPDRIFTDAENKVKTLNTGDGVLILTDMFGATPSNIAHRLSKPGQVMVVTGLNMPMIIRVMNYPKLNLGELVEVAVDGGKDGVIFNRRALS